MRRASMKSTGTGARSMNGCWTCRLRRKKCDEERPCCQNCTRLQLDCSYGQKPAWMDRGVLEREEALAIKNKIAQNTRRRGKSLSSAATSHIMDQDEPPIENLATSISVNQDPVLTEPPLPLFSDGWYESCDLGGSVSHTPGESVPNLDLLLEDCDGDFGLWYSDHSSKSDAVVSPSLSLQAELLQGSDSTENSSKRRRGNTVPSTDFFGSNRSQNMSVWAFPRGDGSTSSSSHPSSIASTLEYGKNASKSKSEGVLTPDDALLVSFYTEKVMPIQFVVTDKGNNAWMSFLLLTSRPVLQLTLTVAKWYKRCCHSGGVKQVDCSDLLAAAMKTIQKLPLPPSAFTTYNKEKQAEIAVTACTCLIQAMHLGMLAVESTVCADCLRRSAHYAPHLLDLVVPEGDTDAQQPTGALEVYISASKAILSHLVWLDVMGAVSCGRQFILSIDYSPLLESRVLNMGITGCHNNIVASIVDIVSLRDWKTAAEGKKALNIMELGARGRQILEVLEANIVATQATEALPDTDLISLSFARAAIIYLHTVISGPNPYLEDIRSQTIDLGKSLHELAQRGIADRSVWPACVMACLSLEEDAITNFSTLALRRSSYNSISHEGNGIVLRSREYLAAVLERGRRCRESRAQDETSDWTLAGHDVAEILLA